MGVPDIYKVSRIAEGRSLQRAITASVLARIHKTTPEKVLRGAWPRGLVEHVLDQWSPLNVMTPIDCDAGIRMRTAGRQFAGASFCHFRSPLVQSCGHHHLLGRAAVGDLTGTGSCERSEQTAEPGQDHLPGLSCPLKAETGVRFP